MKKSKSSSKRRERSKSRSDDSKSKRAKPRPKSQEKEKSRQNSRTAPRKTRWETSDSKDASKKAQILEPATKKEKSGPPLRIKDLLHNKEKIVDLLFQTVTGAALQELIPDYLEKRSKEELKKLCLEQIKTMSDELVLQIISGKFESANKDKEEKVEKEQNLKPEQPSSVEENVKEKDVSVETEKKTEKISASRMEDKLPRESPDIEIIEVKEKAKDDEILIPEDIKEEVAKDLLLSERDAELLELEMRARAIRSLLKAKSNVANENENALKDDH